MNPFLEAELAQSRNALVSQGIEESPAASVLNALTPERRGKMALDILPVTGEIRSAQRAANLMGNLPGVENAIVNNEFNPRAYNQAFMQHGGELGLEVAGTVPLAGSILGMLDIYRNAQRGLNRGKFGQGGMIAGPKAKNADMDKLLTARAMKDEGSKADDIFQETGWWLDHPDGVPRFEIDDSTSSMNMQNFPESGGSPIEVKLGESLNHPRAYMNYPEAKGINVMNKAEDGYGTGSFMGDIDDGMMFVRGSDDNSRSTTLHELQHAIQQREGMARGGSPEMFSFRDVTDANNHNTSLYKTLNSDFARQVESAKGDIKAIIKLKKSNPQEYEKINDALNELQTADFDAARNKIMELDKINQKLDPYQQYKSLAGESEARLVQDRMNMTPEFRANYPFYQNYDVPIDEQILRFGDDVSMSADIPMDEASRVDDYRGQHTAPEKMGLSSLDNMSDIFPDDIYTHGLQYYGTGDDVSDMQSLSVINQLKNNPKGMVTVYRAVPYEKQPSEQLAELEKHMKAYQRRGNVPAAETNGLVGSEWYNDAWDRRAALEEMADTPVDKLGINNNDWVTLSRNYAKQHGLSALNGKYKIISKKVPASTLHTDGNSINEWGYNPSAFEMSADIPMDEVTQDGILFKTGKPVTFNYIHNKESATDIFGIPDKSSPYGRGYEPSGRFVTQTRDINTPDYGNFESGELTFKNPLVIPNDSLGWKKTLSDKFDGKTGKELSQALIDHGYDGVVTTDSTKAGKYISETLDLTTFDKDKAKYSKLLPIPAGLLGAMMMREDETN